jgi:excisionase family DNA binding protein
MTAAPEYLRAGDIARLAGVSVRTVRRWIAEKILPSVKMRGVRLVPRKVLERVLSPQLMPRSRIYPFVTLIFVPVCLLSHDPVVRLRRRSAASPDFTTVPGAINLRAWTFCSAIGHQPFKADHRVKGLSIAL